MKKLLLSLGSTAILALPIVSVVSQTNKNTTKLELHSNQLVEQRIMDDQLVNLDSNVLNTHSSLSKRSTASAVAVVNMLNADLAKFTTITSSKTEAQLNYDVHSLNPTPSELGFKLPYLNSGAVYSFTIDDLVFDHITKKVTITLERQGIKVFKIFELKMKYNFESRRAYLKNLLFPQEEFLMFGQQWNGDYLYYKKQFDLALSRIDSSDEVVLEDAIGNAILAIELANLYNSKILKANQGLSITYHNTNILGNNTNAFSVAISQSGNGIAVAGGKSKVNLGTLNPDGTITFKGAHNVFNGLNIVIHSIISDGNDGYFVGGTSGQFAHIDKDGNVLSSKKIMNGDINAMVLSTNVYLPGVIVSGQHGNVLHVHEDGNIASTWHVLKEGYLTAKNGEDLQIFTMIKDGYGGVFVGGTNGKIENINALGSKNETDFWKEVFLDGNDIKSIVGDRNEGFILAGENGKWTHIDQDGKTLSRTTSLSNNQTINSIVPDEHGGYWVSGTSGVLEHVDASGKALGEWEPKKVFDDSGISSMISDKKGGFWVVGTAGKIKHFSVHLDSNNNVIATDQDTPVIELHEYDFSSDSSNFKDTISTKTAAQLNGYSTKASLTAEELGIAKPELSDGTNVSYSIYSNPILNDQDYIVVVAHLSHNWDTTSVVFNLKLSYDFSADKAKFTQFTSSKNASMLNEFVIQLANIKASSLGFVEPTLSKGTTATYKMSNGNFEGTTAKEVIVTLHHDGWTTTKTFNVVPNAAFDFSSDLAQFKDVVSSKTVAQLLADKIIPYRWLRLEYMTFLKNSVEQDVFGIAKPELSAGTSVTGYFIEDTIFDNGKLKSYFIKVTLCHGTQEIYKKFHLTPKSNFSADIAKFTAVVSSKTAAELSTIGTNTPTAAQLGFTQPTDLTDGVRITSYSIDNHNFDGITSKVVTVTLTYGEETATTTFYLTPKFDFNSLI